jgi:glycosyltransferase involved in cell wall biosynthesis
VKVLFVTHRLEASGVVLQMQEIARHLRGLGWQVEVRTEGRLELRHDLAVVWSTLAHRHALGLAKHLPVVLVVTEARSVVHNRLLDAAGFAALFDAMRCTVFLREFQRDEVFRPFLGPQALARSAVIPNGVLPLPPPSAGAARPAGGRKRIVFVGRLSQLKRPHDLVRAAASLGRDDVECLLVGETGPLASLDAASRRLVERSPRVTLAGELDRQGVADALAGADLFCLPSADEAFGLSPLEAASFGLPLVLSDLPAHRGVWRQGIDCLLSPVGDVGTLAANLRALLEDEALAARLGTAARDTARRFSFEAMARGYREIMERCART